MLVEQTTVEPTEAAEAALEWHNGDAIATIESLLEDCRFLREQIAMARGCISRGLTPGWRPEYERSEG
jgi:hypothetical protein